MRNDVLRNERRNSLLIGCAAWERFASTNHKHYPDLNSAIRPFDDDALLYGTICCDEDEADLQDDLYRLDAWQQKWKMEFNPYHTVFFSVLKLT